MALTVSPSRQPPVRLEGGIDKRIAETRRAGASRRAGRPERGDLAAEKRLQGARAIAMVAMAMRHEDMCEALAFDRGGDRLQVPLVGGTRIDDGDLAAADDVAIGAEKGIGAGIVGDDTPDAGRDLLGDAIIDILTAIESKRCRHGLLWIVGLLVEPAPIVAERKACGSAALLAALTFPSLFAQNVAHHRHLGVSRQRRNPRHADNRKVQTVAVQPGETSHEQAESRWISHLGGFWLGVATIQGLGAKDTAPVFLVAEVEVTDLEGYMKEYVPLVQKSLEASGGRVLAAGQNVTAIEGTPPKGRVVIMQWDSLDQLKAWPELGAI